MKYGYARGFTLLELSVVLVIIGLLIGGVMFGRSMLVTSKLQTVMTDADNYITAVASFKQQYQALPGDMANATSFWGTDSNGCNSGGGKTGTCNGNGDGMIGGISGSGKEYEVFRFWQQLHMAGLATQNFSGVAGSASTLAATVGTNVPAGSMEGTGYSAIWAGGGNQLVDSTDYFAGSWSNVLVFGKAYASNLTVGPALTPDQAQSIDAKIDDGIPGSGKVKSFVSTSTYAPNCTTTAVASTSAYNVSNTGVLCPLVFLTGY